MIVPMPVKRPWGIYYGATIYMTANASEATLMDMLMWQSYDCANASEATLRNMLMGQSYDYANASGATLRDMHMGQSYDCANASEASLMDMLWAIIWSCPWQWNSLEGYAMGQLYIYDYADVTEATLRDMLLGQSYECANAMYATLFLQASVTIMQTRNIWLTHSGLVTPYMASEILINTGSGNDLFPDGTKPLPESMLTYYQWGPRVFVLQ